MVDIDTEFVAEPGQPDIVIRRIFNAPREVVFRAITDPEMIPSWWGPRRFTTAVERMETVPGGRWQFRHGDDTGTYTFRGVFHDVVAPERIVQTSEFEGAPGQVALETLKLEELDGKTQYVNEAMYQSVADRDAAVGSGMESGLRETLDRLAEVVEGR